MDKTVKGVVKDGEDSQIEKFRLQFSSSINRDIAPLKSLVKPSYSSGLAEVIFPSSPTFYKLNVTLQTTSFQKSNNNTLFIV